MGLLLLPSAILSLRRIMGLPSRDVSIPAGRFGLSILLVPIVLAAGSWLFSVGQSNLVAPLHILVSLLIVAWLLWIAIRELHPGSGQRAWGALGAGLALTPVFALMFEIIGGIFLLVILAIYVSSNPALMQTLDSLQSFTQQVNPNIEMLLERLQPFFNDPFVLGTAFIGLGLFVPLIEELFKPIGVMLLLRRPLTAAQGFALGALCGAGYALAENLTIGADAETWALISIGRFGTTIMHIFTTALSGYALARAKNERRYLALFGTYLLNVFIHGAWNSLVVLNSAAAISAMGTNGLIPPAMIVIAGSLLLLLAIICLFFLRRYNLRLAASS